MNMATAAVMAAKAKQRADQSVDFSPLDGAICPECGAKHLRIVTSRPWNDKTKVRYHKCDNKKCLLGSMEISIKSVQSC